MKVEWVTEAAAELDNMLAYIGAQNPSAAALVAGRILVVEQSIAAFPLAGRYDSETDTYDRYIPKTRIVLTYISRRDTLWIISVWHTSRDPDTKLR
jgi:plasmid stabilization system protein ParE